MESHNFKYRIRIDTWDKAKEEAHLVIREVASRRSLIFYSDLVKRITSCELEPHGNALAEMLGEISTEEDITGSGLLSAVVVRKEDGRPGSGFFRLAKRRGREFPDTKSGKDRFWSKEVNRVHDEHS